MYDVELLEKEWKRYRMKRRIPWIGFTLLVALGTTYLLNREVIFRKVSLYFNDINKTASVEIQEQNSTLDNRTLALESNISDTLFNEKIDQELAQKDNLLIEDKPDKKPSMDIEFTQEKVHKRKYLNIVVTDRESRNSNSEMFDTLTIVEKRYNESPNYEDAIYLAEGYYEQKNYEKSQKWALESNNLNSNSEESWLLFAKSKAKLGDYDAAGKILEAYLKENSSQKVEKLLHSIESGKL